MGHDNVHRLRNEVRQRPDDTGAWFELASAVLEEGALEDAYELMIEHASATGANAIICVRYDANEVTSGVTEVLAYGTAVLVEPNA